MDATVRPVLVGPLVTGLLLAIGMADVGSGQDQPARRVLTDPARQPARQPAKTGRLPRSRLQTPDLRVQKLDPQLKSVLVKWERATAEIKALQGEIYRYHREFVFNTEKRARGVFYYEAPDKGRLDITAVKIPKGTTSSVKRPGRRDKKTGRVVPGRMVPLTVTSDNPEKWICDGTQVLEINDSDRTMVSHPIPGEYRGRNIMNGPLPFLFGMPVDKAVKRYHMDLLGTSAREVWIRAWPRWKQDAANYREATVILDTATYLPKHVRLTAPDNTQTIYSFGRLKVNSKLTALTSLFPGGNPFRPNLSRYRVAAAKSDPLVPSVVGLPWKTARDVLTKAGYKVKFTAGRPATRQKLLYAVYQQAPREQAALAPGSQVTLTFFSKPAAGSQ